MQGAALVPWVDRTGAEHSLDRRFDDARLASRFSTGINGTPSTRRMSLLRQPPDSGFRPYRSDVADFDQPTGALPAGALEAELADRRGPGSGVYPTIQSKIKTRSAREPRSTGLRVLKV